MYFSMVITGKRASTRSCEGVYGVGCARCVNTGTVSQLNSGKKGEGEGEGDGEGEGEGEGEGGGGGGVGDGEGDGRGGEGGAGPLMYPEK